MDLRLSALENTKVLMKTYNEKQNTVIKLLGEADAQLDKFPARNSSNEVHRTSSKNDLEATEVCCLFCCFTLVTTQYIPIFILQIVVIIHFTPCHAFDVLWFAFRIFQIIYFYDTLELEFY